jgi:hypothetical protein
VADSFIYARRIIVNPKEGKLMSRVSLLCFLCLVVFLSSTVSAAVSYPFDSDERLARTVSLSAKDAALPAVLVPLSKLTGVPLTCEDDVTALRVTIFLKSQPARRALAMLAGSLRLLARKESDGYRFYRPATAVPHGDPALMAELQRQAELRAQKFAYQRQMSEFLIELFKQQKLSDDEVWALIRQYPAITKRMEEKPWRAVPFRVMTWLPPETWEKACGGGVFLSYKEWTAMGGDADVPTPTPASDLIARHGHLRRPSGGSGIDQIYIRSQPDGQLLIAMDYTFEDGRMTYTEGFLVPR